MKMTFFSGYVHRFSLAPACSGGDSVLGSLHESAARHLASMVKLNPSAKANVNPPNV
jgi:hypothetical protein